MALIAATGTVVWLALPRRARLRGPVDALAPVSLALALLAPAAVVAPYAVDQISLQHVATGLHADNPHFFDMAWLTLVLALVGLLGALLGTARVLQVVSGAGLALDRHRDARPRAGDDHGGPPHRSRSPAGRLGWSRARVVTVRRRQPGA